jgi:hypothetical protein
MIAMIALIGIVLMLVLAYNSYRSARRAINGAMAQEDVFVDGSARGSAGDGDRQVTRGPESAAEAREAALSRQLFDGELDREGYQRAMTELARPNPSQSGGAR